MIEKKEFIDLCPLEEEHIKKNEIDYTDLWMVKDANGQILGPFDTASLQKYSSEHQHLFENAIAYNLATESWKSFFKVNKFQRRRPKLVPIQSLISNVNFLVLIHGERKGPYTLDEMQKFIDDKKIALNVQVSLDNGESWIKLFEHHAFDRRLKKNPEDLPYAPEKELFAHSSVEVQRKVLEGSKLRSEEEEAIIGLAFIGSGNDRGQTIKPDNNEKSKQSQTITYHAVSDWPDLDWMDKIKRKINFKYFASSAMLLLIIFTAYNSHNSRFNMESNNHVKVPTETPTDNKGIDNSQRITTKNPIAVPPKKETKIARARKYEPENLPQKTTRRPASVPERKAHKRTRPSNLEQNPRYEEHNIDEQEGLREEITRELAGDYYGDNDQELSSEQQDFIENANQDGFSDGDYEDMERADERYDHIQDFE